MKLSCVPEDDYGVVTHACYEVHACSFTYFHPPVIFDSFDEAVSYAESLMNSKLNGEKTEYAQIIEYLEGYWSICAIPVAEYGETCNACGIC